LATQLASQSSGIKTTSVPDGEIILNDTSLEYASAVPGVVGSVPSID
jgi:hypothetical protein